LSDTLAPMAVRTLYVEDDDVVRELTTELLSESGLLVTGCGRASEAIALFDQEPFPLLITDIGLPDMQGMDLARVLAERSPELRIVFSSGYPMPRRPDGWNGRAASVDKPIDLDALDGILAELGVANR
jgi:CheY-like chemotaxis protein